MPLPSSLPDLFANVSFFKTARDIMCEGTLEGRYDNTAVIARWKAKKQPLLKPDSLRVLCNAEEKTLDALEKSGHCLKCYDGTCARPTSLTTLVREFTRTRGADCDAVVRAYESSEFENTAKPWIAACMQQRRAKQYPSQCAWFDAWIVNHDFTQDAGNLEYSSSYFPIQRDGPVEEVGKKMLDEMHKFGRGGDDGVDGVYDMTDEGMSDAYLDEALSTDMILSVAAALVVFLAMFIHTRSPWLTAVGFLQVALSFPTAFFVYRLVLGITFFPFLNFIGVFVVFGIGADDVFVAVDKFRNAQHRLGDGADLEEIAAAALPDAATAMLLTSVTTAAAFFATAVCPVPPIRCFSIFLGLLVSTDYLLNLVLVCPALCIHHRWSLRAKNGNCCVACCVDVVGCVTGKTAAAAAAAAADDSDKGGGEKTKSPLIASVLEMYHGALHTVRYPLAVLCIGAFIWSAIVASKIPSPTSSEVQLLADNHPFTLFGRWSKQLLGDELERGEGGYVHIVWGLHAADTGNYLNPDSHSRLVLDTTFDPSSEDAQLYMLNFEKRLLSKPFAKPVSPGKRISVFEKFRDWLEENYRRRKNAAYSMADAYRTSCGNATSLPVPQSHFHACMLSFAREEENSNVLGDGERVRIIRMYMRSDARFDSSFNVLRSAWTDFENFMNDERRRVAPPGVRSMFHSSGHFHWYDTNRSMLETAVEAGGIALAVSAAVVFLSSRSLSATTFAVVSIAYVLTAVTACVVAMGWELGFLEAICFAILIGLSCDFVIHFVHAYCHERGDVSREDRARFAVVSMGPSILAGASTTFSAGVVMFFCVISFFQKFGLVLLLTMAHAVIACFVVFLVLADTLGPNRPTYLFDVAVGFVFKERAEEKARGSASKTALKTNHVFEPSDDEEDQQRHGGSVGAA